MFSASPPHLLASSRLLPHVISWTGHCFFSLDLMRWSLPLTFILCWPGRLFCLPVVSLGLVSNHPAHLSWTGLSTSAALSPDIVSAPRLLSSLGLVFLCLIFLSFLAFSIWGLLRLITWHSLCSSGHWWSPIMYLCSALETGRNVNLTDNRGPMYYCDQMGRAGDQHNKNF